MVMSGRSVYLITLILGRLRPPTRLTSTKCMYFRQELTTSGRSNKSKWPDRVSNSGPVALSQTLSMVAYAKFQYSLNV